MPPLEPLTDEDKRNVVTALASLKDVQAAIADAKRAGLDVTELDEQAKILQTQLEGIQRVYIRPGARPTRASP